MLGSWLHDGTYTLRRLRRRPAYTALTVLTLALGVAGTAAVYSIAKGLLFNPLPYRNEGELVSLWGSGTWSEAEITFLRPELEAGFRGYAAVRPVDVTLTAGDTPVRLVHGVATSAGLFRTLGAAPALGTGFRPEDDRTGAEPVVVLSDALWRELGSSPAIIGQRLELGGVPRTVVGVMPKEFWFTDPSVRIWVADQMDPGDATGTYALYARMPPGVGPDGMQPAIGRISERLGERFRYPEGFDKTKGATLEPMREHLVGSVRPALLAMLGAMAVILLIACVNVAALMLGQVDSRGTELAVRAALGAGRRHLVQQLVVEAAVIGLIAGALGGVLALLGFRFLVGALPLGALAGTASVDWSLFAAAIVIAIAAATAVSLVPGVSIARADPQTRLSGSRTGGVKGRGGRLEAALVVAQVGLVLLMAAGAGLLIRSVGKLRAIDPGVNVEGVAVVDLLLPSSVDVSRRPQLVREIVAAVQGVPGVESVSAAQKLPLRGPGDDWGMGVESRPDLGITSTYGRIVTPGYFQTMGIPVTAGRPLLDSDRLLRNEGVVVINQALAEKYFPGVDPIGQRIAYSPDRWDRIVGVVGNVAEAELSGGPVPARYYLYEHVPFLLEWQSVVVRARGGADPASLLNAVRIRAQEVAPGVAVRELTTMENVLTRAIGPARQVMALLSLLGALALALGTIGVYGVVSHFVRRRRRDWGIRIALGLSPTAVTRQIVGQAQALVVAGIVLGVAGFFALARLLAGFLYGVGTADPLSIAGAATLMVAAGLLASWIPARRASRIQPAQVLREE
jgi:putative ABC transport system permease protein